MKMYMIYCKEEGTEKFYPMDTSKGCIVKSLIRATVIREPQKQKALDYVDTLKKEYPKDGFELREIK